MIICYESVIIIHNWIQIEQRNQVDSSIRSLNVSDLVAAGEVGISASDSHREDFSPAAARPGVICQADSLKTAHNVQIASALSARKVAKVTQ